MSNMFEVGHRVVCVDTSCVERVLEKGKRYTIIGVDELFVQLEGFEEWFYYDRFERYYVNEEIEYNLKDKYGATLSVVRLYKDKTVIEISELTDDILSVHLTDAQIRDLRKILKEI